MTKTIQFFVFFITSLFSTNTTIWCSEKSSHAKALEALDTHLNNHPDQKQALWKEIQCREDEIKSLKIELAIAKLPKRQRLEMEYIYYNKRS